MSRPTPMAGAGLLALRAAVTERHHAEQRARLGAGRVAAGPAVAFRVASPSRPGGGAARVAAPAGAPGQGGAEAPAGAPGQGGVEAPAGAPVPAGADPPAGAPVPAGAEAPTGAPVPAGADAPADVLLPSPAPPGDDELAGAAARPAPPEGDSVVTQALVERSQQGDAEAFGQLYDRYVDLVYRYIYYRVGTCQLAEDLTSETFLRALRRISTFTWQGRDVGAWFVTIARNLIADHYKSGRYRLEMTTDDILESGASLVEAGPETAVLEAMQNAVLLAAVKQLNPEQQECIVLRFLQGMSVAETAQVMGKNDGAVKALQYRAIRSLGRLLPQGLEL